MTNSLGTDLDTVGYSLTHVEPDLDAFIQASKEVGASLGARTFGYDTLLSDGSATPMPVHTESIYSDVPGLPGYFALGCIAPSLEGGATTIYDARAAADYLQQTAPELCRTEIAYSALAYPGQTGVHHLVFDSPNFGHVLRFRQRVETNRILSPLPGNLPEDDFYSLMDEALKHSLVMAHEWQPGELLVVNNGFTLHGRQSFRGRREMVRTRFDDPNNRIVELVR